MSTDRTFFTNEDVGALEHEIDELVVCAQRPVTGRSPNRERHHRMKCVRNFSREWTKPMENSKIIFNSL